MKRKLNFKSLFSRISKLLVLLLFLSSFGNCLQAIRSPFDMNNPKSLMQTLVLLLSSAPRTLNSYRFSYSGANPTWTSGICGVADQSTGIGPYTFNLDATDDVLFTVNSNLTFPPVGSCNGMVGELRLYIDGVKQQTSNFDRCWGQHSTMNTAFVVPSVTQGDHTLELKFCTTDSSDVPFIDSSNYVNILTATRLGSISNYEGRASSNLTIGSSGMGATTPFWPIHDDNTGNDLEANYTPTNDVILWQGLNLGGAIGLLSGINIGLRLAPLTTEDLYFLDDGATAMSMFTYTPESAGVPKQISAQYNIGFGKNITTKSTYDNTLTLLAFKVPEANTYGKSVFTGPAVESAGTNTPLINIPITNTSTKRYLISFTGNNSNGSAGGAGCEFALFINNSEIAKVPQVNSSGGFSTNASMITIESIPEGSAVPVEIQFKRFLPTTTCTVNLATLTVLPFE